MSEQEWVETECPACDGGGRGYMQVSKPKVEAVPPIIERLDALRARNLSVPVFRQALGEAYPELRTLLLDALRENERLQCVLTAADREMEMWISLFTNADETIERYRKALEEIRDYAALDGHGPMTARYVEHAAREALGGNDAANK